MWLAGWPSLPAQTKILIIMIIILSSNAVLIGIKGTNVITSICCCTGLSSDRRLWQLLYMVETLLLTRWTLSVPVASSAILTWLRRWFLIILSIIIVVILLSFIIFIILKIFRVLFTFTIVIGVVVIVVTVLFTFVAPVALLITHIT